MAAAYSHYVHSKQRILEYLGDTVVTENVVQNFAGLGRYFMNIRRVAIGLIEISALEPVYRGHRVRLRIAGETPRPDRTSDQVHRSLKMRNDSFQDHPVELAQRQPLGATRCSGDRPNG